MDTKKAKTAKLVLQYFGNNFNTRGTMSTAVLTNLLDYLYGTLSPSNMRWVGERLIEHANQEENKVKPYTMQEIDDILTAAEEDFKNGDVVTNEEVIRRHAEMLSK